jgi:hypothetical protein
MRSTNTQVIRDKVAGLLGKSRAFHALSETQRRQVLDDTSRVVDEMARSARARGETNGDPYHGLSLGLDASTAPPPPVTTTPGTTQGAPPVSTASGGDATQMGESIAVGVTQAARMVREIDFPTFVASLVEGTFHAIVKSSIEQMKAYAEMVRSVATSLNDFKDQNTTDNQARDSLVSRYPSLFQISVGDSGPRVGLRDDANTDNLPDFQKDLGLPQPVDSLDDDTIEAQLVPAMRDEVALARQKLLATIVMMGINRIVVTDGRINAKLRFQFSATETSKKNATSYDYANMGQINVSGSSQQLGDTSGTGDGSDYTSGSDGSTPVPSSSDMFTRADGKSAYATGQIDQMSVSRPDVRVTSEVNTKTDASLQASGQIMGEVAINFRSETFPLEKFADANQMNLLAQAQGAGRATPPPAAAPASTTPAAATPPATPPAPAPAPSTTAAPAAAR